MRYISKILASIRVFSGSGYWVMSVKFFRDPPWLPWQRNLGQNCLTLLIWEICPRFLHRPVGFRAVELFNDVSEILPRLTLVAMATKFGSKLAINRLICQISPIFLSVTGGYRGLAVVRCRANFPRRTLVAMATKLGSKLVITRLIWEICPRFLHRPGVFGVGLFNDVSQILPRPTLVAMATKFELKLAITRLICEISPRFLRPTGGFRGLAI